jgi:hypothetical protein
MSDLSAHSYRDLMLEAERENAIVGSPEGQALIDAICKAVRAYADFLEQSGLVFEWDQPRDNPDGCPRMKASALVVTADFGEGYGGIDVRLKDGAFDRIYGSGRNPDPYGYGPPDIPQA